MEGIDTCECHFGISSASEIWQRAMEEEFGNIEGVEIIADDSSPGFPQSNGQVERCVHTVKNLIKKENARENPFLS